MSLSVTEIAAVVGEIAPLIEGGWIQRISQPLARVVILEIRRPGKTARLLLSATPGTARLHLLSASLSSPPSPPPFCQYLRAHIQGAHIDSITQVGQDRIIRISLQAEVGACALIAELVGKKADILYVDGQENIAATLCANKDRIGQPYQAPLAIHRPTAAGDSRLADHSPLTTSEDISANIEVRYRLLDEQLTREQQRQTRLVSLRKAIKKGARRVEALQQDLDKALKYRDYARYGELIKASLGKIAKGQSHLTAVDYFDEALPELTIPLDPTKSPQGNMVDYFKKHRKCLTADRTLRPRLDDAQKEIDSMRRELEATQDPDWQPPEPAQAKPDHPKLARRQRQAAEQQQRGPFRRFTSADGIPIFVGRNARENEDLTFGLAKSDDLWLHARGTPGSHVVVRLEKGANPPPETLKDAATLALLYSDLKKSGSGDVIYTRRKWVRKVKGHQPGTVTVTQEKSLFVQLDKARLHALKARAEDRTST